MGRRSRIRTRLRNRQLDPPEPTGERRPPPTSLDDPELVAAARERAKARAAEPEPPLPYVDPDRPQLGRAPPRRRRGLLPRDF